MLVDYINRHFLEQLSGARVQLLRLLCALHDGEDVQDLAHVEIESVLDRAEEEAVFLDLSVILEAGDGGSVAEVDAVIVIDAREFAVGYFYSAARPGVDLAGFDGLVPVLGGVVEEVALDHCVVRIHDIYVEDLALGAPFVSSHG